MKLFGVETFRRATTRFQPAQAGPVDENYRLGPGDMLVLILTGDVERSHTLEVTREGFVVIPQVGQVYVANLTLGQLEDQLYGRLGRVYSGVRRGAQRHHPVPALDRPAPERPGLRRGRRGAARRVPDLQRRHGAHRPLRRRRPHRERQLPARSDPPRPGKLVDSLDLYDYLLRGINPTDVRLQSGDVVFVPVHGG